MDEINNASLELKQSSALTLKQVGYIVLAATAFLLPFFFIPSKFVPLEVSKTLVLSVGVIAAFFIYLLHSIKHGEFEFPQHKFFWVVLLVPVVFFASAVMSSNPHASLFGADFHAGAWAYVTLGCLLLFLVAETFKTKQQIYWAYLGFAASFLIVLIVTLAKFFLGGDTLSFGVMSGVSNGPVGAWTDSASFFGAVVVLAVMALELLKLRRNVKIFLVLSLALSLFVLAVLNFAIVWLLLLVFSLVFFVYIASSERRVGDGGRTVKRISYAALVLMIVSIVFFFNPSVSGKGKLGDLITARFSASNLDVRPSLTATGGIIKHTLEAKPLLGTGPGTFDKNWLLYKPRGVNTSDFWNLSFPAGFGLLPTFAATTGLLGVLAWLGFFFFYLKLGAKALFQEETSDNLSRFFTASSFLTSLFLWVLSFVYVPRITIFMLAFFFTGLFIASILSTGLVSRRVISFSNNAKLSFASVLVLIVLLVGNVSFAYSMVQDSVSGIYFQRAVLGANAGNIDGALSELDKAASLSANDLYYRALAQVRIAKLNNIIADTKITDTEKVKLFQETLGETITSAQGALNIDPDNYQNWLVLGQIYESLVPPPLSVEGAYENAKNSYEEALKRNPYSPEIELLLARLEVANGNNEGAREHIRLSIEQKNNYADAYFLLTQIELSENRIKQAIESAEVLALLSPNNAGIFFQLGLLKYNDGDFSGAAEALLGATRIVPNYANAKYFLGLSFEKLGNNELAIKEFRELKESNPDNQEIDLILSNLESGSDPFKGFPPAQSRPERRQEPPLKEQN